MNQGSPQQRCRTGRPSRQPSLTLIREVIQGWPALVITPPISSAHSPPLQQRKLKALHHNGVTNAEISLRPIVVVLTSLPPLSSLEPRNGEQGPARGALPEIPDQFFDLTY